MAEFTSPYARAIQQTGYQYPTAMIQSQPAKPSVWEAYRQAILPTGPEPVSHVQSAVAGLRGNLEAAALSALLGVIYGKFGTLDVAGKYPIDGILAAVLYALSVKEAGKPDGFAQDLRNLSQTCTAVACFRKTAEFAKSPNIEVSGESSNMSGHKSGEDPLVAAARKFGLAA